MRYHKMWHPIKISIVMKDLNIFKKRNMNILNILNYNMYILCFTLVMEYIKYTMLNMVLFLHLIG